jgi:hypothetical protein
MTQQQKQKERPQQATRTVGEIVIATLDLLLSLPLIFVLVKVFQARAPGDNVNGTSAGLFLATCIVLLSAGLLLWARQYKLARLFQWIAALSTLIFTLISVIQIWSHITTLWITCVLYGAVTLVLTTLALLLQKQKEN